jgi:ABC-type multidrug transport system fused ATPase/permease subunit
MRNVDIKELGHILIHPYDGFESMSYHKRGSPLLSFIIISCFFLFTLFERHSLAFRFNYYSAENTNVFMVFISTFFLVCIAVVANWALSTLWDGKAAPRMIWIVFGYSLFPYVMGILARTLLSHLCTYEDATFLSIMMAGCAIWSGLIFWFGMLQVQEYSAGKNLACMIGTVIGMMLIMFLCFLLILLFKELFAFIASIVNEIMIRTGM